MRWISGLLLLGLLAVAGLYVAAGRVAPPQSTITETQSHCRPSQLRRRDRRSAKRAVHHADALCVTLTPEVVLPASVSAGCREKRGNARSFCSAAIGMPGLAGSDHLHFATLVGGRMVNPAEW